ncbi:MAG TPA: hypothetical protein VHT91_03770 [Kofleriaceae bacterium]|nr:hypothetical protein [Kofleriaceae bacterium]
MRCPPEASRADDAASTPGDAPERDRTEAIQDVVVDHDDALDVTMDMLGPAPRAPAGW